VRKKRTHVEERFLAEVRVNPVLGGKRMGRKIIRFFIQEGTGGFVILSKRNENFNFRENKRSAASMGNRLGRGSRQRGDGEIGATCCGREKNQGGTGIAELRGFRKFGGKEALRDSGKVRGGLPLFEGGDQGMAGMRC